MKQAIDKFTIELPGMDTSTAPENNAIHEAVEFYWGGRCSEHEEGCATCGAWKLYDKLIGN
jgi:hypothetical protein